MFGSLVEQFESFLKREKSSNFSLDIESSKKNEACIFHLISIVNSSGFINRILVEGDVYVTDTHVFYEDSSSLKHFISANNGDIYIDEIKSEDALLIINDPNLNNGINIFRK